LGIIGFGEPEIYPARQLFMPCLLVFVLACHFDSPNSILWVDFGEIDNLGGRWATKKSPEKGSV
jgi:hypothetical protein